jgi:hypothetical protein
LQAIAAREFQALGDHWVRLSRQAMAFKNLICLRGRLDQRGFCGDAVTSQPFQGRAGLCVVVQRNADKRPAPTLLVLLRHFSDNSTRRHSAHLPRSNRDRRNRRP